MKGLGINPFVGFIILDDYYLRRKQTMHMADALISPIVGGTMTAVTVGLAAYSIKKVKAEMDDSKIPLMGVMGAFIFASQMINFSIPGTGSSGHLGGGMLLAVLLGPFAGFLTMASVLLMQALFFGDGGLLAFGCNVFNLGFFSCFIAYPLIYKGFTRKGVTAKRIFGGSMLSAVAGLQLGAFGVVLETLFSGKTELPFGTFVMMMQPIHLAIGIVEGLVTTVVVTFIWKAKPDLIDHAVAVNAADKKSTKKVLVGLLAAAVIVGGGLSWFASSNPDGLEWSMEKVAGTTELESTDPIHQFMADIQNKLAFLPGYAFKSSETAAETAQAAWPDVNAGTSVSGIVGGALTLSFAALTGLIIRFVKNRKKKSTV